MVEVLRLRVLIGERIRAVSLGCDVHGQMTILTADLDIAERCLTVDLAISRYCKGLISYLHFTVLTVQVHREALFRRHIRSIGMEITVRSAQVVNTFRDDTRNGFRRHRHRLFGVVAVGVRHLYIEDVFVRSIALHVSFRSHIRQIIAVLLIAGDRHTCLAFSRSKLIAIFAFGHRKRIGPIAYLHCHRGRRALSIVGGNVRPHVEVRKSNRDYSRSIRYFRRGQLIQHRAVVGNGEMYLSAGSIPISINYSNRKIMGQMFIVSQNFVVFRSSI